MKARLLFFFNQIKHWSLGCKYWLIKYWFKKKWDLSRIFIHLWNIMTLHYLLWMLYIIRVLYTFAHLSVSHKWLNDSLLDRPCRVKQTLFSKISTNCYNPLRTMVPTWSDRVSIDTEEAVNAFLMAANSNILPEATGAPHETFFTSKGMANEITFAILSRQVFCPCPPASKVMTKLRLTIKHKCSSTCVYVMCVYRRSMFRAWGTTIST